MRNWLFTRVLRLPPFKGKWRLVRTIRAWLFKPYQCRVVNGLLLEVDSYEWAQLYLAEHGATEPRTMELLGRLLKPGDSYIDVGAHVGFVSLVARQAVGAEGRVIAIEPQPYNCERLLRNWELNRFSNLCLHVAAAGPSAGFVQLPQQAATDKSRMSLELPMADALDLKFEVPMVAVGDLIAKYSLSSVQMLKIDVEGYELGVLEGLADRASVVKNIVFEALEPTQGGRVTAVCDWLRARGYTIRTVVGEVWDGTFPTLECNLWASKN